MKKNVLIKGILVLVVIALLTIGFTGCFCDVATVNITIPDHKYVYQIYIDEVLWGSTDSLGNLTLYDVPKGQHVFDATSTNYFGKAIYNVVCNINNNVVIYTMAYPKLK